MLIVGVAAGISNGIAGGGTFVTFPAMLALGIGSLAANVSETVGVAPSNPGGMWRFRDRVTPHRRLVATLPPSRVAGAGLGCALLLAFAATTFRTIVPWLIGAGTLLFALSIHREATRTRPPHAPRTSLVPLRGDLPRRGLRGLLRCRTGHLAPRRHGHRPALRTGPTPGSSRRALDPDQLRRRDRLSRTRSPRRLGRRHSPGRHRDGGLDRDLAHPTTLAARGARPGRGHSGRDADSPSVTYEVLAHGWRKAIRWHKSRLFH